MDPETIRALFASLRREGVEYVLVGAVALDVLGIGRLTEDIDLFVRPTADNVERLRRALRAVWDDPSIQEITADDLAGRYRWCNTSHPMTRASTSWLAWARRSPSTT